MTFSILIRLAAVCLLYSTIVFASDLWDETEWRVLAARCFARCLTFDPTATEKKQQWAPYSYADFNECGWPCVRHMQSTLRECLRDCSGGARCEKSCHFIQELLLEPIGASFSPGNSYLPAIPPSPPTIGLSGGSVKIQWDAPSPVYPTPGVNHGVGYGSVFMVQYAVVHCGQSVDTVEWMSTPFPAEDTTQPIGNTTQDNEKNLFSGDQIYVFRVATVNPNGTQGFTPMSPAAYGIDKICVNRSDVATVPAAVNKDISFLAFRDLGSSDNVTTLDVEIVWEEPQFNKPPCYHVCLREEANELPGNVQCLDRTVFEEITTKTYVFGGDAAKAIDSCPYKAVVSSLPLYIASSTSFRNQVFKSATWSNITLSIEDRIRFVPRNLATSQVKALGHRIDVTLTWLLPINPNPTLARYLLTYGSGKKSVPIFGQPSVKLGEESIVLSEAVDGKFTRHFPDLEPESDYWFKVLAVAGTFGKSSEEVSVLTLEFPLPGVPSSIDVLVIDSGTLSSHFTAVVTWENSKPADRMDYPVMASYLQWGIGKSFDEPSVIGVAAVNGTTERYEIVDLFKSYDDSHVNYWLQVWSSNQKGNSSKSTPFEFFFQFSSDNLLAAYIAVPLVLCAVIVIVICLIIYCHWRKKRQKIILYSLPDPMAPNLLYGQPPLSPHEIPDEWEVAINRVVLDYKLGEGFFGEVWKAMISGSFGPSERHASIVRSLSVRRRIEPQAATEDQSIPVAVKLLKDNATEDDRRDLLNEIKLMKRIGSHRHIVSMMGCCTVTELYLIVEYVPYGDLLNFLRKNRVSSTPQRHPTLQSQGLPSGSLENGDGYVPPSLLSTSSVEQHKYADYREPFSLAGQQFHEDGTPCVSLTSLLLLSFGHQITQGMDYLHSKDLVHRDLACRNILVDDNQLLKISDFGLCRAIYKDLAYVKKTKGRLPLKWMSVEAIFDHEFTKQSDVWSFGIVLWEVCTMGGFPYPTIPNETLLSKLRGGYRMEKPPNCSQELYDLMMDCWTENPHRRPTFSDLVVIFGKMLCGETHSHLLATDVNEDSDYYLTPVQVEGLLRSNLTQEEEEEDLDEASQHHYDKILETRQRYREEKELQRKMDEAQSNGGHELMGRNDDNLDCELRVQLPSASKQTSV